MKNLVLTLLFAVGLVLIWVGDLRLMLTGVFLAVDAIGAQIYFDFRTLDDHLALVGTDMLTIMGDSLKSLDALEEERPKSQSACHVRTTIFDLSVDCNKIAMLVGVVIVTTTGRTSNGI